MTRDESTSQFERFLAEALEDDEVRAGFEDGQSRSRLVDALVRMRTRLGLTQKEVARRMGVKQPTVSGFETEDSDPRVSTILRYSRAVDSVLVWDIRPRLDCVLNENYRESSAKVRASVNRAEPSQRAAGWRDQVAGEKRWLEAVS